MPDTTIAPSLTCENCGRRARSYDLTYFHPSPGCSSDRSVRVCYDCSNQLRYWNTTTLDCVGPYIKTGTMRAFGVEVETSACPEYNRLRGKTCFGVHCDGSISGMEFISPILSGDIGLKAIRHFLKLANKRGFRINSDCGLHVHIDARDLTGLQRRKVAYAFAKTEHVWQSFVTEFRARDCSFCHTLEYTPNEIQHTCGQFMNFALNQSRYNWFNIAALHSHGSFEIRLHQGSLDPVQICNWIIALLKFVEAVKDKKYHELDSLFDSSANVQFYQIKRLWGSKRLSRYYNNVTRLTVNRGEENRLRCRDYNNSRALTPN